MVALVGLEVEVYRVDVVGEVGLAHRRVVAPLALELAVQVPGWQFNRIKRSPKSQIGYSAYRIL